MAQPDVIADTQLLVLSQPPLLESTQSKSIIDHWLPPLSEHEEEVESNTLEENEKEQFDDRTRMTEVCNDKDGPMQKESENIQSSDIKANSIIDRRALLKRAKSAARRLSSSHPMSLTELLEREAQSRKACISKGSCLKQGIDKQIVEEQEKQEAATESKRKVVRFATNSSSDKVWCLVRSYEVAGSNPPQDMQMKTELFWSDVELDVLYGQQQEQQQQQKESGEDNNTESKIEPTESADRELVKTLRELYDPVYREGMVNNSIFDDTYIEQANNHKVSTTPFATQIESGNRPKANPDAIRPLCLQHRRAVLKAQEELRKENDSSWIFDDAALAHIRQVSLNFSRSEEQKEEEKKTSATLKTNYSRKDSSRANDRERSKSPRRSMKKSKSWSKEKASTEIDTKQNQDIVELPQSGARKMKKNRSLLDSETKLGDELILQQRQSNSPKKKRGERSKSPKKKQTNKKDSIINSTATEEALKKRSEKRYRSKSPQKKNAGGTNESMANGVVQTIEIEKDNDGGDDGLPKTVDQPSESQNDDSLSHKQNNTKDGDTSAKGSDGNRSKSPRKERKAIATANRKKKKDRSNSPRRRASPKKSIVSEAVEHVTNNIENSTDKNSSNIMKSNEASPDSKQSIPSSPVNKGKQPSPRRGVTKTLSWNHHNTVYGKEAIASVAALLSPNVEAPNRMPHVGSTPGGKNRHGSPQRGLMEKTDSWSHGSGGGLNNLEPYSSSATKRNLNERRHLNRRSESDIILPEQKRCESPQRGMMQKTVSWSYGIGGGNLNVHGSPAFKKNGEEKLRSLSPRRVLNSPNTTNGYPRTPISKDRGSNNNIGLTLNNKRSPRPSLPKATSWNQQGMQGKALVQSKSIESPITPHQRQSSQVESKSPTRKWFVTMIPLS